MSMIKIRFGDYLLDEARYALLRSGEVVALRPKAFDLLVHLVRHADRVVRREELVRVVWGGTRVGAGSLAGLVNELRRALGERGRAASVIRTVHARGYQFVGKTSDERSEEVAPADAIDAVAAEAMRHASALGPVGLVLERPASASGASEEEGAARAIEAFAKRGFEVHRIRCRVGVGMSPGRLSREIVESLVARRSRDAVAAALPLPARRWLENGASDPVAGGRGPSTLEPPGGLTAVAAGVARCAGASPLALALEAFDETAAELVRAISDFFRALGSAPVVVVVVPESSSSSSCSRGSHVVSRLVDESGFRLVSGGRDPATDAALEERRALEAWRHVWSLESIPEPIEAALIGHLRGDRPLLRAEAVENASDQVGVIDASTSRATFEGAPVEGPARPGMRRVETAARRLRAEGDGC